jgi:hypothetical protein
MGFYGTEETVAAVGSNFTTFLVVLSRSLYVRVSIGAAFGVVENSLRSATQTIELNEFFSKT